MGGRAANSSATAPDTAPLCCRTNSRCSQRENRPGGCSLCPCVDKCVRQHDQSSRHPAPCAISMRSPSMRSKACPKILSRHAQLWANAPRMACCRLPGFEVPGARDAYLRWPNRSLACITGKRSNSATCHCLRHMLVPQSEGHPRRRRTHATFCIRWSVVDVYIIACAAIKRWYRDWICY